jgi:DeoR/GlpR family transcriptional regulator of sugar metabolism
MLAAQRQALIVEEVQRRGAVRVSDLTRQFGVSEMTIRRDLDLLVQQGVVDKVHGGATTPRASSTEEPGFEAKWLQQQKEKEAIARAAARQVKPGTAVGLSAGTTTWTLAHELREIPGLTVVTNSIQVAEVLYGGTADQTVVLTGGVRTPSDALVGPVAVAALRSLHVDLLFLGAHGVDPTTGLTTPNLVESETNRALVASARHVCVLADSSKWGTIGLSTFADISEIDLFVTDNGLPERARAALSEAVGSIEIVEA